MWTGRRILKELTDPDLRKQILTDFWRYADDSSKALATVKLAQALRFRAETMRKMPLERKADLLASRLGDREFDEFFEAALMQYHTHEKNEMMAEFLDRWGIPHQNGSIEADDYSRPTADQVRAAVAELESQYGRRDIALYLASAGLLMDEEWENGVWPVVDEITAG